jgi:uncharacterized protein (TIGR02246 family)
MKEAFSLILLLTLFSCGSAVDSSPQLTKAEAIQEIYYVEQAFNELLAKEGRAAAFAHFAAEDGAINRGGKMIIGKAAIKAFYAASTTTNVSLTWVPDKVQMSDDLTMASTWGKYQFTGTSEDGEAQESTGIFHTVWKRQQDGSWRYIYD